MVVKPTRQPTPAAKKASKTYNEAPPGIRTQQSTTDDNLVRKRDESGNLTGETVARAGADSYITRMAEEAKAARTGVRNFDMATTPTNTTLFTGRSVDPATGETVYVDPSTPSQAIERAALNLISGANGRNSWSAAPGDGFTAQQIPDIYKILQQASNGKGEYRVSAKGIQTFAPDDPRKLQVGRGMDVPLRTLVNEPTPEEGYRALDTETGRVPLNADGLPPSPNSLPVFKRVGTQVYQDLDGKMVTEPIPERPGFETPFITPETASQYPNGAYSRIAYYDGGNIDPNAGVDYQDGKGSYPQAASQETKFGDTVQGTVNPAIYYRGRDGKAIRVLPDSRVVVPQADGQIYTADGRSLTPQVLAMNAQGKAVARTTSKAMGVGGMTPNAVRDLGRFGQDISVDADTFRGPAGGRQTMGRQGNPSVAATVRLDGSPDRYINPDALPMGTSVFDVTPGGTPVRSIPRGYTNAGASDDGSTVNQIMNALNADTRSNGDPGSNSKGGGTGRNNEVDEAAGQFGKDRVKAGDIIEEISRQADEQSPDNALPLEDTRASFYSKNGERWLGDGRQQAKALEDMTIGGGGRSQPTGEPNPIPLIGQQAQSGDMLFRNPITKNSTGPGLGGGLPYRNLPQIAQDLENMQVAGQPYYTSGEMEFPDANATSAMMGSVATRQQYDNEQRARLVGQQLREFARRRSPVNDPIETDTPYAFAFKNDLGPGQKINENQNFVPGPQGSLVKEVRPDSQVARQAGNPQTAAAIAALESDFGEVYNLLKDAKAYDISSSAGSNSDRQRAPKDVPKGLEILFSPGRETDLGADSKVPRFPEAIFLPTIDPNDRVKAPFPTSSTVRIASSQSDDPSAYSAGDKFVEAAIGGILSRTEQMYNAQTGEVEGVKQYMMPGRSYMEQFNEIGSAADLNKRMLRRALTDEYDRGAMYLDDDRRPMAPHYDYKGPDGIPLQEKYAAEDRANGLPVRPTAYDTAKRVHEIARPQYGRPFDGNEADPVLSQFSPQVLKQAYATKELNNRLAEATETVYKYHTEFSPTPDQDNLTRTITVQNADGTTSTIKKMMTTEQLMNLQRQTRELSLPRMVSDYSDKLVSLKPSYRLVSPAGEELPNPLEKNFSPYTMPAPTQEPPQFQGGLPDAEQMSYGSPGIDRARQLKTGAIMMGLGGTRGLSQPLNYEMADVRKPQVDVTRGNDGVFLLNYTKGNNTGDNLSVGRAFDERGQDIPLGGGPAVQQIPQSRDRVNDDFVERDRLREQVRQNLEARQSFSAIPSGKTPRTPDEMAAEAQMAADAERAAIELDQRIKQQAEARQAVSYQYRGD